MRKSKYQSLGILDFIERKLYGGMPKYDYHRLYKDYNQVQPITRSAFSKKVYSLDRHGLIEYANDQEFILTDRGLRRINFIRLEKLKLENKKRDGLWRIIIFDVPEKNRSARELLRSKLLDFECYQLQKSVYATPYVCEKEVNEIARILNISRFIDIILAKSLGKKEDKTKRHFN